MIDSLEKPCENCKGIGTITQTTKCNSCENLAKLGRKCQCVNGKLTTKYSCLCRGGKVPTAEGWELIEFFKHYVTAELEEKIDRIRDEM